jgi:hypothetical protein
MLIRAIHLANSSSHTASIVSKMAHHISMIYGFYYGQLLLVAFIKRMFNEKQKTIILAASVCSAL